MLVSSKGWWAAAIAGGLLLSGCNRNEGASQKTLGEKFDNATEKVEQTTERAAEKAQADAAAARDKIAATADKIETKIDHAADRIEARSDQAGDTVSDAVTTGKVKAALIAATSLTAFHIDVDTKNKVVTLTGNVDNAAAVEQALSIARSVDGVAAVENRLIVAARN